MLSYTTFPILFGCKNTFVLCSSGKLKFGLYLRNAGRIGWVCDSESTICAKTFITYITATLPAPSVLAVDVFGTGSSHRRLVPQNRYQPHTMRLPFASSFLHFLSRKLQFTRTRQHVLCIAARASKTTEYKAETPLTANKHFSEKRARRVYFSKYLE
jgi:hypothetical protein